MLLLQSISLAIAAFGVDRIAVVFGLLGAALGTVTAPALLAAVVSIINHFRGGK